MEIKTEDRADGTDELYRSTHMHSEKQETNNDFPRRDFLKLAGFTLATLAVGCERPPDHKTIPHVILDPESTPGTSVWYAGVCAACTAGCGILVRNRDNRPVKLEGLPGHPVSNGGLCAAGQASLLALYDSKRLKTPLLAGKAVSWKDFDAAVKEEFRNLRQSAGRVRVLTSTVNSPSLQNTITTFLAGFANGRQVCYDTFSASAILDVHQEAFGTRILPRFHLSAARVIVSFDADFLATWVSPVEYSSAWASRRSVDRQPRSMSWHVQVEARMSLTGSKADYRLALTGAEQYALLCHLHYRISLLAGLNVGTVLPEAPVEDTVLHLLSSQLWQARGEALLLCGTNDIRSQRLVLQMNDLLASYGTTIDISSPSLQKQGSDSAFYDLVNEIKQGEVDALLIVNVNPVYDAPDAWKLPDLISALPFAIHITTHTDETSTHTHFVCPAPHFLEEWSDTRPVSGVYCISQPMIPPAQTIRSVIETLSTWSGKPLTAYDSIRAYWKEKLFPHNEASDFENWWNTAVESGYIRVSETYPERKLKYAALEYTESDVAFDLKNALELIVHPCVGLPDSRAGGNAWLLELPDPITKCSWENVASLSKMTAEKYGVSQGDVVRISIGSNGGKTLDLPVLIQEGQADLTIAVAMGYGTLQSARFIKAQASWWFERPNTGANGTVGTRVSGVRRFSEASLHDGRLYVNISATGSRIELSLSQEYQYLAVPGPQGDGSGKQRPCVQEVSFPNLVAGTLPQRTEHELHSMWKEYEYNGYHWGMTIDLNACTGCSACIIGCQVENNIPVVGKEEVRRNREMYWLRIDRYYFTDADDNLRVAHQPMLCHHCDNAPCETVCPVLATVHSTEGLNQQVYNRCVGTRYCSNNCPYKVRRFNWFNYERDEEENLVLNPDVTVRTRGVMEKCSFCVQRIQEAKITAKSGTGFVNDGDIQPACMQSCPTNAIRFGDMNDSGSVLAQNMRSKRYYRVLEDVGVNPSVGYLMQVKNMPASKKENDNG